ncbi:MAG: bifunctional riboflavin kinase/FAD synthetase [Flavobacteriia bacterium]|nr:bifunctional riboflavin kinase/FAD synthetase [Flavobacteriia bacterium]
MEVHHDIYQIKAIKNPVVTIGTFDGVHIGHQKIIQQLLDKAKEIDGESVLITFYPHPRKIIDKTFQLDLISTKEEKEEKLKDLGLNHLIYIPFTKEFAEKSALDFLQDVLINSLHVHTLIVGYDHRFGNNREGDIHFLNQYSPIFNYKVEEISAQVIEETKVSSSKIRTALNEGKVELAAIYLNQHYKLTGKVVIGKQIGKTLGFPTANILVSDSDKLIPKNGVYAVKISLLSKNYFGMLNIGFNPSVSEKNTQSIEVHLFDFNENIYGQELTLHFIQFIREEQKFSSLEELKKQLSTDEKNCRTLFYSVSAK